MIPFIEKNKNKIKVHCATGSANDDPLKAFMFGYFKDWQEYQRKKNFSREYILSIIYISKNEWLFAGIYKSISVKEHPYGNGYLYDTELTEIGKEYIGRAVIGFKKTFRQSYVCLENYLDDLELVALFKENYKITFPGYENVDVTWKDLSKLIYTDSWKTALENQKGVYLITDVCSGKRYVGAAYGEEMLLGRWSEYIKNGHGGNAELKRMDFDYIKQYFKYTILEIFKATTSDDIILKRESWWKDVLLTRDKRFGFNDN